MGVKEVGVLSSFVSRRSVGADGYGRKFIHHAATI